MDLVLLIVSGGVVGFAIGLTGVGGGSLMTPILLLLNYPPAVAIGTDLLYAAATKASGVFFHHRKRNIQWRTMLLMAAGSIPVSLLIHAFVIDQAMQENDDFELLLTRFLGGMLVVTSMVILFQNAIRARSNGGARTGSGEYSRHTGIMTVVLGVVLGVCVTLSSVGAGAFGAAVLFLLYSQWPTVRVVGTDIAHAVPLTFVAGLGYLFNGLVDFRLLLALVAGALPGIYLGTMMGSYLPDRIMRPILVALLLALGLYFILPFSD